MGEAHQVTIQSDSTPSADPGATDVHVTSADADSVSIPTDQTEPDESSDVSEDTSARPEWLLEKFGSPEEMAKAYTELESRLGEPAQEEETEPDGLESSDLQPFYDEFAESGGLKEDSFALLAEMGLERDLVEAFMEGQLAKHQTELTNIYASVGGEDAYTSALGWATEALSEDEIAAYNQQVESGDPSVAAMAVQGMMARFQQSGNSTANQPHLLRSEPIGPGGPNPYESIAQVMQDMSAPEYKSDPAFREKVKQRLARSSVM